MKSIFGLDENVVAALSYVFGPFSGIAVLIMERENKFVRFHALQSTLWFIFLLIAGWGIGLVSGLFGWVPILGWGLGLILSSIMVFGRLLYIGSKIYLAFRAYQGATFKLPIIGEVVWSQVNN